MHKLWLLLLVLLLLAPAAFAGDFRIVPGQRIGSVTLGMSRASVHTLLHAPSTTRRVHGLVVDTWLSHQLLRTSPNGNTVGLKRDYLTVFFRNSHAVQIEVSAPKFKTADGFSTGGLGEDFGGHYSNYRIPHFAADPSIHFLGEEYAVTGDPAYSSPAGKHFVTYGDAVHEGIAWKAGAWGDASPKADPEGSLEAVIVHIPGNAVLLNSNDGLPYSGTGPTRQ
jgi:hypothetical protein